MKLKQQFSLVGCALGVVARMHKKLGKQLLSMCEICAAYVLMVKCNFGWRYMKLVDLLGQPPNIRILTLYRMDS